MFTPRRLLINTERSTGKCCRRRLSQPSQRRHQHSYGRRHSRRPSLLVEPAAPPTLRGCRGRLSQRRFRPALEDRNMARETATWGPQRSAYECSLTFRGGVFGKPRRLLVPLFQLRFPGLQRPGCLRQRFLNHLGRRIHCRVSSRDLLQDITHTRLVVLCKRWSVSSP